MELGSVLKKLTLEMCDMAEFEYYPDRPEARVVQDDLVLNWLTGSDTQHYERSPKQNPSNEEAFSALFELPEVPIPQPSVSASSTSQDYIHVQESESSNAHKDESPSQQHIDETRACGGESPPYDEEQQCPSPSIVQPFSLGLSDNCFTDDPPYLEPYDKVDGSTGTSSLQDQDGGSSNDTGELFSGYKKTSFTGSCNQQPPENIKQSTPAKRKRGRPKKRRMNSKSNLADTPNLKPDTPNCKKSSSLRRSRRGERPINGSHGSGEPGNSEPENERFDVSVDESSDGGNYSPPKKKKTLKVKLSKKERNGKSCRVQKLKTCSSKQQQSKKQVRPSLPSQRGKKSPIKNNDFSAANDEMGEEMPSLIKDEDNEEFLDDENSDLDGSIDSEALWEDDEPEDDEFAEFRDDHKVAGRHGNEFTWFEGCGFTPQDIPFTAPQGGIPQGLKEDHFSSLEDRQNALTYFMLTFPMDVIHLIVKETNRFFQLNCNNLLRDGLELPSIFRRWVPVDADTIFVFLALTMLMGHMRKTSVGQYWSTDDLLQTPIFSKYMARNRYQLILRFLHFSDSSKQPATDRLFKIREVVQMINLSFRTVYYPHKNVCIDESLLLFKGRVIFRQYIKSKRARYGIKFFVIADSLTGYVLCIFVYTSTGFEEEELCLPDTPEMARLGKSGQVVVALIEDYLDKGHTLYCDNWYSSPYLFQYLLSRGTYAVGTVRNNCVGLPKITEHMSNKPTKKHPVPTSVIVHHSSNMEYVVWYDHKPVKMLSTEVKHEMLVSSRIDPKSRRGKIKPSSVLSYNKNMGGVDLSDMQLSFVKTTRKTLKWYRKVFFHLMDLAVRNAFIMYKEMNSVKRMTLGDYRMVIIRSLLEKHGVPCKEGSTRYRRHPGLDRLVVGGHYLRRLKKDRVSVPMDGKRGVNNFRSRRCYVCSHTTLGKKRVRRVSYECETCNVGLCPLSCFKKYHTQEVF